MRHLPTTNLLIGIENSQLRDQITHYLQEQGSFTVTAVATAEHFLDALAKGNGTPDTRYDILILPDALPSLKNGRLVTTLRQLLPIIQKQFPDLPVLLLSDCAYSAVQLRQGGIYRQLPMQRSLSELGLAVSDTAEFLHFKRLAQTTTQSASANGEPPQSNNTKITRLEKLTQAASQIVSKVGRVSPEEMLTLIARHATEILQAEAGSILLVRRPGYLSFEAGHGYTSQGIQKGREFAIRKGYRTGLTGHIAYEKQLFNAHGAELVNHTAVRGQEIPYMKSRECYAMLAIPLLQQVSGADEPVLLGLLRLDNKKNPQG